ncbi:hypothetical protein Droror1_Dr00027363, partial [Drosera rotundifolia]
VLARTQTLTCGLLPYKVAIHLKAQQSYEPGVQIHCFIHTVIMKTVFMGLLGVPESLGYLCLYRMMG